MHKYCKARLPYFHITASCVNITVLLEAICSLFGFVILWLYAILSIISAEIFHFKLLLIKKILCNLPLVIEKWTELWSGSALIREPSKKLISIHAK